MVRTQIQLPDEVYARARQVCASREISFAELSRRGLEYILSVYAPPPRSTAEWKIPTRKMGWKGLSNAALKEQAQLTNSEVFLLRQRKK